MRIDRPASQFTVRLAAATGADLSAAAAQPCGPERRSAAVEALHMRSRADAPRARAQLLDDLRAIDPGATVRGVEELWLDNSQVVSLSLDPSRFSASAGGLAAFLAERGADLLDASALPPPDASGPTDTPPVPTPTSARAERQWFDEPLGIAAAHRAGLDGRGISIAVVDSGIDARHPQLAGALHAPRGAVIDRWHDAPGVRPGYGSGHGTFVAGLAAGSTTGVAPGAALISSRTYGAEFGDTSDAPIERRIAQRVNAVRALQDALAPHGDARAGADIIVASWGMIGAPASTAADYARAMRALTDAGVVVMAAAGNDGGDPRSGAPRISNPASLSDVFAVAGLGRDLHWHPQSSVGPSPFSSGPAKPDFAAPAANVRSLAPNGQYVDTSSNPGGGFAGTSAAAPIAAGMIALFDQRLAQRSMAPVDARELRALLPKLTVDLTPEGIDAATGHGGLSLQRIDDAIAALADLRRRAAALSGEIH